jgi:hypothetical protein
VSAFSFPVLENENVWHSVFLGTGTHFAFSTSVPGIWIAYSISEKPNPSFVPCCCEGKQVSVARNEDAVSFSRTGNAFQRIEQGYDTSITFHLEINENPSLVPVLGNATPLVTFF